MIRIRYEIVSYSNNMSKNKGMGFVPLHWQSYNYLSI